MLDEKDLRILEELGKNSRRSIAELADELQIPRSTIYNRIKKLERLDIIKTYKAIVDHEKLGRELTALVHIKITSKESAETIANDLKKLSYVDDIFLVTGQYDIIVKARFEGTHELSEFIYEEKGLRDREGIERTESMIVLKTIKEYGLV